MRGYRDEQFLIKQQQTSVNAGVCRKHSKVTLINIVYHPLTVRFASTTPAKLKSFKVGISRVFGKPRHGLHLFYSSSEEEEVLLTKMLNSANKYP